MADGLRQLFVSAPNAATHNNEAALRYQSAIINAENIPTLSAGKKICPASGGSIPDRSARHRLQQCASQYQRNTPEAELREVRISRDEHLTTICRDADIR